MMDLIYTWLAVSAFCVIGSFMLLDPKELKKESKEDSDKVIANIFVFGFLPIINCIFALIVATALLSKVNKFFKKETK